MTDSFVVGDLGQQSPMGAFFSEKLAEMRAQGEVIILSTRWITKFAHTDRAFDHIGGLVVGEMDGSTLSAVVTDPICARIVIDVGNVSVMGAMPASQQGRFAQLVARLKMAFPEDQPEERQEIPFRFWVLTPNGPRKIVRPIAAHRWDEIQSNYSERTGQGISHLLNGFQPSHGGQLLLWSGEPGTGKTHAIRSLAWEMREWCRFEYVVDPDRFFGEEANYMITALLDSDENSPYSSEESWRMLILEDTGELLTADAKERAGQGLSRLLNVVDGIIGQGLRILVLVTTNEDIKTMHPAVSRPGRCASRIDFTYLSPRESSEWLVAHGIPAAKVTRERTLAELYAEVEQFQIHRSMRAVGFTGEVR